MNKEINLKTIRTYNSNQYDEFIEFEFDNGEFALLNLYITNIDDRESFSSENFIILNQSIIDELKKDDDTIWENIDKYLSENMKNTKEDKELYNEYRELIIKCLEINKNFNI